MCEPKHQFTLSLSSYNLITYILDLANNIISKEIWKVIKSCSLKIIYSYIQLIYTTLTWRTATLVLVKKLCRLLYDDGRIIVLVIILEESVTNISNWSSTSENKPENRLLHHQPCSLMFKTVSCKLDIFTKSQQPKSTKRFLRFSIAKMFKELYFIIHMGNIIPVWVISY